MIKVIIGKKDKLLYQK